MNYTFKIQFGDTDAAGIVYYPNFYRYMDNATHHFFEQLGFPTSEMMKKGQAIPLVEAHCQFLSPGFFNHEISIITKVEYVKDKVFKLLHIMKDGEHVIAKGYEVRVWVSLEGEKPKAQSIPDNLRNQLQKYQI